MLKVKVINDRRNFSIAIVNVVKIRLNLALTSAHSPAQNVVTNILYLKNLSETPVAVGGAWMMSADFVSVTFPL